MKPFFAQAFWMRPEFLHLHEPWGKNRQASERDRRPGQNYHFTERNRENDPRNPFCLHHPPIWPSSFHFLTSFVCVHVPVGMCGSMSAALLRRQRCHSGCRHEFIYSMQSSLANDATNLDWTGVGWEAVVLVRHCGYTAALVCECVWDGEGKLRQDVTAEPSAVWSSNHPAYPRLSIFFSVYHFYPTYISQPWLCDQTTKNLSLSQA